MSLIEWTGNEPEDIIITKVLKSATSDHWYAVYQAWESYLNENLTFPFDAKIFDGEYSNNFKIGDRVSIKKICLIDDPHGLIVDVYKSRNKFALPLWGNDRVADTKRKVEKNILDFSLFQTYS